MTYTLHTDKDGTFLVDENGELLPLIPNAHSILKAIYERAFDADAGNERETGLRLAVQAIRNMAHEGLK